MSQHGGTSNSDKILAAMEAEVWYRPADLDEKAGVTRSFTYLTRMQRQGLVRRRSSGTTGASLYEYRKVIS